MSEEQNCQPQTTEECPDCGELALPVIILVVLVVVLAWVVA